MPDPLVPGPAPSPHVQGLEVTWPRTLSVWWALAWRTALAIPLAAGVGCAIGFVFGVLGHALKARQDTVLLVIRLITMPVGFLISMLIGLWAVHMVLKKSFREFRIVLVPREGRLPGQPS